jgi:ATP-dependent Clp protease ATP-binding subunit ClpA
MLERFTDRARTVVIEARTEAKELHHAHIGTEHLLLAMLVADGGIAHQVLIDAGLDAVGVRADIERLVTAAPRLLSDEDAAALRTIGIDLDAVLARIEESFGPDALEPPPPPQRRGLLGRRWQHSRFTPRSKKVLELSLREALRLGDKHIGTEHILLGLIREGDGLATLIVTQRGIKLDDLRRATLTALGKAA